MDTKIGKRIREARLKLGLTQKELSMAIECSQAEISRVEKDEQEPKLNLIRFFNSKGVSLLPGLDASYPDMDISRYKGTIPVFEADVFASNLEVGHSQEYIKSHVYVEGISADVAVAVYGDSMEPLIKSGDIVLCKEVIDMGSIIYDEIYLIVTKTQTVVKYLHYSKINGEVLLSSQNSNHSPFPVRKQSIIRLYAVLGFIRKTTM